MDARIDLAADRNDEDDEGPGWSTLHFTVLPGSVEKNRHLIGRALA